MGFRPSALPFIPGARFSDAVTAHLTAAGYLRHSIAAEEVFPLWNEALFAGTPFAANPLNKTAYPLEWIGAFIPADLFLNGMIVLHLTLAIWGIMRWTSGLGLRREAVLFCGLAYGLSPRLIGHLGAGHLDIVYAMAWLPWVMDAAHKLFEPGDSESPLLIRLTALGTFAAFMVIGDVRVGFFGLLIAIVYGISLFWRLQSVQRAQMIPVVMGAGGLFVILTAALSVPLLLWSPYLSRAGLTQADAGIFALQPLDFLGMLLPLQRANPETLTYLGLPVLVLAFAACATQFRKHRLWIGLAAALALYAMGANGGLWTVLTSAIPALLWFRVPSRAWIMVALMAVLLAGYGFDGLLRALQKRGVRRLTLPVLIVFGLTTTDLFLSGQHWLEWRGGENWLEPYVPLARRLLPLEPDRIYQPAYSLPQQAAQLFYLHLFGGVDPFQIDGVARAIREAGGISDDHYSVIQPPLTGVTGDDLTQANQGAALDTAALAAWKVSHVIAPYDLNQDGLTWIDTVDGIRIYRVDAYQPDEPHNPTVPAAYPRWAERPDLPSAIEIGRLNAATSGVHVVSWIGFTFSGLIAAWASLRQRVKS
ncbi:MAG: hypothetical protein U0670_01400 [Anaerolineae bacterium]